MKDNNKVTVTAVVGLAFAAAIGLAAVGASGAKNASSKSSEANTITNENGSVSRTFTESTITTNGSMVTEHRRETRTTMDTKGNLLESSTSEYAQSYPVGSEAESISMAGVADAKKSGGVKTTPTDSFLSLKFGEVFKGSTNFVADADEPTLLQAKFTPKKPLAGFDDYYVYVTPTTHKVVKIFACAKNAVEPGARWRRHYLIEALEKKYGAWARLASYWKPLYAFDIGDGREIRVCLAGANESYETVIAAWDDAMLTAAADETAAIREEARKNAAEKRRARIDDAADAF